MFATGTKIHCSDGTWEGSDPIDEAHAHSLLKQWHEDGVKLCFGYLRSRGGIVQTGTATILRFSPNGLTLDTNGSRIAALLHGAKFQIGNLGLLTPDFRAVHDIDGLSVVLSNCDWLFLFVDDGLVDPEALARPGGLFPVE